MTSGIARLYALVGALAVFFVTWALIAARPWQAEPAAASDPRLASLQAREQRLRAEALQVQRLVTERLATYRAAQSRQDQGGQAGVAPATTAPAVRIVTLPAVTATRSS